MLNIKEAMANGMTREDIMRAMDTAEQELAAEADAANELDVLRGDTIMAVLDYARALGVLPAELVLTDEDMNSIIEAVKEAEAEFQAKMAFMSMLGGLKPLNKSKKGKVVMHMPENHEAEITGTIEVADEDKWSDFIKRLESL